MTDQDKQTKDSLGFTKTDLRPIDPFFNNMIFTLVKQPIVCSVDNDLHLYEVFIRVRLNGKLIDTGKFFDYLTDHATASTVLDMWVVEQVNKLKDKGKYAINLTQHSLESIYFADWVMKYSGLIFEVAERQKLTDQILKHIEKISKAHQLLLDDFGTAYSNLDSLRKLQPFLTAVKIDGAIVLGCHDKMNRTLIGGAMRMIEQLELQAVAECIESTELLECVRRTRSDYAPELKLWLQGWLFGKPQLVDFSKD